MGNKDMRLAGAVTLKNLICLWDLLKLIKDISFLDKHVICFVTCLARAEGKVNLLTLLKKNL